jgi:hypothetical protein
MDATFDRGQLVALPATRPGLVTAQAVVFW